MGRLTPSGDGVAWIYAACCLTFLHFLLATASLPLQADGWSHYELSRTVAHDFLRFNTWRAFDSTVPYSSAFPPLWTGLIGLGNRLLPVGLKMGYVLGALCVLAMTGVAEATARRLRMPGAGALATLALFGCWLFPNEVVAGVSPPLSLLCLALQVALVAGAYHAPALPFALGALVGLTALTRFDQLAPGAVMLAGLTALRRDWRFGLKAGLACAAMLSPWMAFSWLKFGRAFATDNAWVAASVDPNAFVSDFHAAPTRSLRDDPVAWLLKLAARLPRLSRVVIMNFLVSVSPPACALVALWARRRWPARWAALPPAQRHAWAGVMLALAGCAAGSLAYLATGYFEARYHVPLFWLLTAAALGLLHASAPPAVRAPALLALALLSFGVANAKIARHADYRLRWPTQQALAAEFAAIEACLAELEDAEDAAEAPLLFLQDAQMAMRYGALTGRAASLPPANWGSLRRHEAGAFLRRYGIRLAYVSKPADAALGEGSVRLTPLPGCDAHLMAIDL